MSEEPHKVENCVSSASLLAFPLKYFFKSFLRGVKDYLTVYWTILSLLILVICVVTMVIGFNFHFVVLVVMLYLS